MSTQSNSTTPEIKDSGKIKKLSELIREIKVAMLSTVGPDGAVHSRPMFCQEMDADGELWFFTRLSSGKVDSIEYEQHVNLAYSSPENSQFVSVAGRASIVYDRAKAEELWSPLHKAWFPEGLDDPDLTLLKVRAESAEYWDMPSAKMVQLFGMARAMLTGKAYSPSTSENRRVEIHH